MPNTDADTSSESEKEEVAVEVAVVKQRKFANSKTDDTENITIDPLLISKIKLNKVQVRQLKKLQAEAVNGEKPIPPINPIKEAKKAEAKVKRDKVKAEKAAIIAEKVRLAKLLEDEAKRIADIKAKYITFKVPIYKQLHKKKIVAIATAAKEVIEDDEADNDETSEEEKPKPSRRRRFQKEKVELDTSDEERVAKLESIDKALEAFAFAPRKRRFF